MYLKRVRELREDHDLKQINISKFLKMKQPQYARYENGNRDMPLEYLIRLAEFYNTSVDYILGLTNESDPYPRVKG